MSTTKENITLKDPNNTVKVTISTERVEEVITKLLETIPNITTTPQQDIEIGSKDINIVDLLRVESRYTIDGKIVTGLGTASPERYDVSDKKEDLKKLLNAGGVIVMTYEGEDINVNFEKLVITQETSGGSDTVTKYDVKFTVIKGENY